MNLLDRLHRAAHDAGIVIAYDDKCPTSMTGMDKKTKKLTIVLGKKYTDGDIGVQTYLMAHELGHIARGDLLAQVDQPDLWNLASDACIAAHLKESILGEYEPGDVVTLDKLKMGFPTVELPEYASAADPIYRALKEECEEMIKQMQENSGCTTKPGGDEDGGLTIRDRKEIVKAQARLRASDEGGDLPSQHIGYRKPRPPAQQPDTRLSNLFRKVVHRIRTREGRSMRIPQRSWARAGRTPYTRGIVRRDAARIVVALDVSGSMEPLAIQSMNLIGGLVKEGHEVHYIAWATEAMKCRRAEDILTAQVGGGTLLGPALRVADDIRPDLLVIISDAQIGDSPHQPSYPVIWAVFGDTEHPWGERAQL